MSCEQSFYIFPCTLEKVMLKVRLSQNEFMQCWTVGAIFTFGRRQMFGPEKLRPSAVDRSRSCRLKKIKIYVIDVLISNHSN